MKIRTYKKGDAIAAAHLIQNTYKNFNKNEGTKNAVQWYINLFDTSKNIENINKMFNSSEITFVAEENEEIIGIIRGNQDRIFNLFVSGKHHKKGIGQKLLIKFEKKAAAMGIKAISVRSSLYAVGFYQKHGYIKTTGIRSFRGLKVQPMKKLLG